MYKDSFKKILLFCFFLLVSSCLDDPWAQPQADKAKAPKDPSNASSSQKPTNGNTFVFEGSCQLNFQPAPREEEASFLLESSLQDIMITSPSLAYAPLPKQLPILQSYFRAYPSTRLLILYLWAAECELCIKEARQLRDFLSTVNQKSHLKVVALSQSRTRTSFQQKVKENLFSSSVFKNHVNENSPNGDDLCRTLYASSERPLLLAIDRDLVVRQALVYPFTSQRQTLFLDGIRRFLEGRTDISQSEISKKLATFLKGPELNLWIAEKKLQHLFASSLLQRVPKTSSYLKVLAFSLDEEAKSWLQTSMQTVNQPAKKGPGRVMMAETFFLNHPGPPLILILDDKNQIRQAFVGPPTGTQQNQFYFSMEKLIRFYKEFENEQGLK